MWLLVVWALVKAVVVVAAVLWAGRYLDAMPPRRALFVVLLIAVLSRVVWIALVSHPLTGDESWYHARATAVAAGDGFTIGGHPTARLAPGFPLLLSAFYRLVGPSVALARTVNLFLTCAVIGLTFRLASRLFGPATANAAGLLMAVWPGQIPYGGAVLSEPLFAVLCLGACATLVGAQRSWLARALLVGALLGGAVLTRPAALLFAPVVGVMAWLTGARPTRVVSVTAIAVIVMTASVTAWGYRNFRAFGAWIPLTTSSGLALWQGNNPASHGLPSDANVEPYLDLGEVARDARARVDAVRYIKDHKGRALRLFGAKLYRTFETDAEVADSAMAATPALPGAARRVFVAVTTTFFNTMMLLYCGFVASILADPARRRVGFVVILPVAYFGLAQAPFIAQYRYNYPAIPFVAIGVAAVLADLGRLMHRWSSRPAPVAEGAVS